MEKYNSDFESQIPIGSKRNRGRQNVSKINEKISILHDVQVEGRKYADVALEHEMSVSALS